MEQENRKDTKVSGNIKPARKRIGWGYKSAVTPRIWILQEATESATLSLRGIRKFRKRKKNAQVK